MPRGYFTYIGIINGNRVVFFVLNVVPRYLTRENNMLGDCMKSSSKDTSFVHISRPKIDGLEQERRNSSALAIGLSLSCINPSRCRMSLLL